MVNNTTSRGRTVMAASALVAGVLMLTLIPTYGETITNSIIKALGQMFQKSQDPHPAAAAKLAAFYFPMWIGLTMLAGATLLILVRPIYRGDYWARPLALGMLAFPSITAAFLFGPVMNSSKQLAGIDGIILLIGLVPYLIILLTEKSPGKDKAANATIFLLLGVLIAFAFTNGFSALHELKSRVDPKFYEGEFFIYAVCFPMIWLGCASTIAGLPLLAGRSKTGWWMVTMGVVAMVMGLAAFSFVNPNAFYLGNLALAAIVLVLMLLPGVGGRLIDDKIPGKLGFLTFGTKEQAL